MKFDIVIAGNRSQEVLSAATIIAAAARRIGLEVLQNGAQVRVADRPIDTSPLPPGEADLILGLDPAAALAELPVLSPSGTIVASSDNAPDDVLWSILKMPAGHVVDASRIAREHGGAQTAHIVMIGAAADFLPCDPGDLRVAIVETFAEKGSRVVDVTLAAFDAGRAALRHREIVDEFDTLASVRH